MYQKLLVESATIRLSQQPFHIPSYYKLLLQNLYNLLQNLDKKTYIMCRFLRCEKSISLSESLRFANKTRALRRKKKCAQTGAVLFLQQKTVRSRGKYKIIIKFNFLWSTQELNFWPIVFFNIYKRLNKVKFHENYTFRSWYSFSSNRQQFGKITKLG